MIFVGNLISLIPRRDNIRDNMQYRYNNGSIRCDRVGSDHHKKIGRRPLKRHPVLRHMTVHASFLFVLMSLCVLSIVYPIDSVVSSSFEYVPMPKEDFHKWYTESDLCVLSKESGDPLVNFKSCRKKGDQPIRMCGSTHGGIGLGGPRRNCNPPASYRTFFFKYLKGFGPEQQPVAKLIEFLQNKTSIVFVGDSLMYQMADAFVCEAFRENRMKGAKVIGERFLNVYAPSKLLLSIDESRTNIDISVHYMRMNMMGNREHFDGKLWTPVMGKIMNESSSVVIVTNIGLYHKDIGNYERDIAEYIEFLHKKVLQSAGKLIVFYRETSAQHWSYGSGYYDKSYNSTWQVHHRDHRNASKLPTLRCFESQKEETMKLDWKNIVLRDILLKNGENNRYHKTVRFLRGFMNITQPLFNMHNEVVNTTDIRAMDCTHYCYFPSMWLPLFKQMFDDVVAMSSSTSTGST